MDHLSVHCIWRREVIIKYERKEKKEVGGRRGRGRRRRRRRRRRKEEEEEEGRKRRRWRRIRRIGRGFLKSGQQERFSQYFTSILPKFLTQELM
jgi:hypothetical protein